MRDLAASLNIKAASLYAHIRSKDELLEWICFSIAGRFFEGLNEVKNADLPAKERLNLFIEKHLSIVLENPDVTHIYSNEWKPYGRETFGICRTQEAIPKRSGATYI